jgi:hypothetical protein
LLVTEDRGVALVDVQHRIKVVRSDKSEGYFLTQALRRLPAVVATAKVVAGKRLSGMGAD